MAKQSETSDCADLRSFYEKEGISARRYDSKNFWETRYHQKKSSIVASILAVVLRKNDLVLDAGCGTGELSLIAGKLGGCVVSLDLAKSYLKRISRNVENRVCASVCCLPFKSSVFDTVICADVVEHIPDYDEALAELSRVSSRTLVLTTPCHGTLRALFWRFFPVQLAHIDKKVGHIHIVSLSNLQQRLLKPNWETTCKSYHVLQPIADRFLSKRLEHLVDLYEKICDVVLPGKGTISLAVAVRS